jgi:hypothetical protein
MLYSPVCDGEVTVNGGAPECTTGWLVQPAVTPFDASQIDPVIAVKWLSFGFGIVLTLWITSRSIKAVIDVIYRNFPR